MIERRKTRYELDRDADSNVGCWSFAAGLVFGLCIGFLMGWVANAV